MILVQNSPEAEELSAQSCKSVFFMLTVHTVRTLVVHRHTEVKID